MSGALSAIATGAGVASLANSIINGADGFLVLGNVTFAGIELPATMPFGGTQSLVKHDLPGGVRYIDAMGAFSRDAQWTGIFFGPDAVARAQALDAMRKTGAPVPLSWDVFYYSVVVSSFDADYHNPQHVTYSITCTVLQDLSQPAPPSTVSPVLQAYQDVNTALGIVQAGAQYIQSYPTAPATTIAAAQTALQGNPLIVGSTAYVSAVSAAQAAQTATVSARDTAGVTVDASGAVANASALNAVVAQAGVAAGMAAAAGYAGRGVLNATAGAV